MKLKVQPLSQGCLTLMEKKEVLVWSLQKTMTHEGKKIHGKPQNWKKKTKGDGWVFQVANDKAQWQQINSKMPSLTKKPLEHLYKFFQSPQFLVTLTPSSLAQKGNCLTIAFF